MADVLNLALKKEIFEGLKMGVTNEIPIEKTNWWKKRLMNVDTGRFKPFTEVVASCGSADKYVYEIEKIELVNDTFIVTVVNPKMNEPKGEVISPEQIQAEIIEPVTINPVTINEDGMASMEKPIEPETIMEDVKEMVIEQMKSEEQEQEEEPEPEPEPEEEQKEDKDAKDIYTLTNSLLDRFCSLKSVYVVNMPKVTIRNNGQIFGCNKRLIADRDSDVIFEFKTEEIVKRPNMGDGIFILKLTNLLASLLKNNYVFINRNECKFRKDDHDNLIFTLRAIAKRKYFFQK